MPRRKSIITAPSVGELSRDRAAATLCGLAALALCAMLGQQLAAVAAPADARDLWRLDQALVALVNFMAALAIASRRLPMAWTLASLATALTVAAIGLAGAISSASFASLVLLAVAAAAFGWMDALGDRLSSKSRHSSAARADPWLLKVVATLTGAAVAGGLLGRGDASELALLWGAWTLSAALVWLPKHWLRATTVADSPWFSILNPFRASVLAWVAYALWNRHLDPTSHGALLTGAAAALGINFAEQSAADHTIHHPIEPSNIDPKRSAWWSDFILPVVIVFPWLFWNSARQARPPFAFDWLLLSFALLVMAAAAAVGRRSLLKPSRAMPMEQAAAGLWMLLAGGAITAWPADIRPWPVSFSVWLGIAMSIACVLLLAAALAGRQAAQSLLKLLQYGLLIVAALSSVAFILDSISSIGGVDFFYYLCNARDLAAGEPGALERFRYFPGAFFAWRVFFTLASPTLDNAQSFYALILLANAMLTGWLAWRGASCLTAALFAAAWYLILASRYQGLEGVIEPLSTLPMLAGLILWNGSALRGSRGFVHAVCLGIAVGLSLFCKQQAGLLSLGFLSCLVAWAKTRGEQRHSLSLLLLTPLFAAATCTALLLIEGLAIGQPWLPLRQGLTVAANYPTEGSALLNYYALLRTDETAVVAGVAMLAAWAWSWNRFAGQPWSNVLGWLAFAWAASMLQFISRPYGHYALLGAPMLAAGATIAAWRWCELGASPTMASSLPMRSLATIALALPLCYVTTNVDAHSAWRLGHRLAKPMWHQHEDTAEDLRALRAWIQPGDHIYVAPSRHAEPYWLLDARAVARSGYGFQTRSTEGQPWRGGQWVLIIHGRLDQADQQWWPEARRDELKQRIVEQGWTLAVQLPTVALYQAPQ